MRRPDIRRRAMERAASAANFASPSLMGLMMLVLAGCSTDLGGSALTPLPYQRSNAFASAGYSESLIGPDRYRIEVNGPSNTPRERLEKIAATRAAEIGTEFRLGYFKIDSLAHTTRCERFTTGGQKSGGSETRRLQYAVLTADVSYAKVPPDPSYIEAKPAFAQYRAGLDTDVPPPPLPADAAPPQCG